MLSTSQPTSLLAVLAIVAGTLSPALAPAARGQHVTRPAKPFAVDYAPATPASGPYVLTPKAGLSPRINGTRVFGVRPGSAFLFTIAATGEAPLSFSADG